MQALKMLTELFVFKGGSPEFYNAEIETLRLDYAEQMILQNRADEALAALGEAFESAKAFDGYLDRLRKKARWNTKRPLSQGQGTTLQRSAQKKAVPELLDCILKDRDEIFYKALNGDPRYGALIRRVEKELESGE